MLKTITTLGTLVTALLVQQGSAAAQVASTCSGMPALTGIGDTITLADTAHVYTRFCNGTAGYTSDLSVDGTVNAWIATGNVTPAGTVVDIGVHTQGTELIFSIYVRNTGDTFYTGPGYRNPDGLWHAAVMPLANGELYVGFEDLWGGGDGDFDDIQFIVSVQALDQDGDGDPDTSDNCPNVANSDQTDSDGDGAGDACDACAFDPDDDADGDGVCGDVDNCAATPNPGQDDFDVDGLGDACDPDDDNDTVFDTLDNCWLTYNPDQADADGDGAGDACDSDDDGDGVLDADDACLTTAPGSIINGEGCSIADLCPCDGAWKNHGGYVSCVAHAGNDFRDLGLITAAQRSTLVSTAAQSTCGK